MKLGLSTRGSLALVRVAKTWAASRGRRHVVPARRGRARPPGPGPPGAAHPRGVVRRRHHRLGDRPGAGVGGGARGPRLTRPRLTAAGWGVLGLGSVALVAGWWLGWTELLVLGTSGLVLVALGAGGGAGAAGGAGRAVARAGPHLGGRRGAGGARAAARPGAAARARGRGPGRGPPARPRADPGPAAVPATRAAPPRGDRGVDHPAWDPPGRPGDPPALGRARAGAATAGVGRTRRPVRPAPRSSGSSRCAAASSTTSKGS